MAEFIQRLRLFERVQQSLRQSPVTAVVGPRQCGKTWLARQLATHIFDADNPLDQARLSSNSLSALGGLEGVILIDEVQQMPELFPVLRVLADDPVPRRTFLLTGSASPELMGRAADRLAGRVRFIQMGGFDLTEAGADKTDDLWLRGGFPLSFLAETDSASAAWREDFVKTYLQRELRTLAETRLSPLQLYRFLAMLAHCHGHIKHQADLANSLALDVKTVRRHLDIFAGAYLLRQLPAFEENVGKRLRKSPKLYLRDSGLLHTLLRIGTREDLETNLVRGASWEGFALEQVLRILGAPDEDCYYWRTQAGAELDLLVMRGQKRFGFEFKSSDRPATSKSMHIALDDLKLDKLFVVYPGAESFPLADRLEAFGISDLIHLPSTLAA
jgi:uncharacterized protein